MPVNLEDEEQKIADIEKTILDRSEHLPKHRRMDQGDDLNQAKQEIVEQIERRKS